MTSDRAPNAMSMEDLLSLLAGAPSDKVNGELPPMGSSVPALPIGDEQAGILDLAVFMEQVIAASGGAPLVQVLQCLIFLAGGATERVRESVAELEALDDPGAMEAAEEMQRQAYLLSQATRMITKAVGPATIGSIVYRCAEENIPVADGAMIPRRIFVSTALLETLGLDPVAYTAWLRRRVPIQE